MAEPEEGIKYEFVDFVQTKKEKIPYSICSVVAVFKMLIRILNTLRSRIWNMVFFLFSDYSKSTVGENGGLYTNLFEGLKKRKPKI